MKHKAPIFLEYLWLLIAIVSLGLFFYEWYVTNFKESIPLLIIVFLAILIYAFRRNTRIKNKQKES